MNRWFPLAAAVTIVTATTIPARSLIADDDNFSASLTFDFSRESERAVARAEAALGRGDLLTGLRQLQALLNAPADCLIERRGTYRSCWETANDLIADLSEQDRAAYHRLAEQPAQLLLAEARRRNDGDRILRLTDQYRHTTAGKQAALQMALRALDRGEVDSATRWLELLDRISTSAPPPEALVRQRLDQVRAHHPGARTSSPVDAETNAATDSPWRTDFGLSIRARRAILDSLGELDAQALNPISTCRPLIVGIGSSHVRCSVFSVLMFGPDSRSGTTTSHPRQHNSRGCRVTSTVGVNGASSRLG